MKCIDQNRSLLVGMTENNWISECKNTINLYQKRTIVYLSRFSQSVTNRRKKIWSIQSIIQTKFVGCAKLIEISCTIFFILQFSDIILSMNLSMQTFLADLCFAIAKTDELAKVDELFKKLRNEQRISRLFYWRWNNWLVPQSKYWTLLPVCNSLHNNRNLHRFHVLLKKIIIFFLVLQSMFRTIIFHPFQKSIVLALFAVK